MSSIITLKKPTPFVSASDWYYNVFETKRTCNELRDDALQSEYDSNRLRDKTDITTHWRTRHTEHAFAVRSKEITVWKNVIQSLYEDIGKEVKLMQDEKNLNEDVIEILDLNFQITNLCSSIREERSAADFCHDITSVELDNEKCMLEKHKIELTQLCEIAWEQINKLQELRMNVADDLDNKNNTICVDNKLLKMTKNSADIYLENPSVVKDFITYEKWLKRCNFVKISIKGELDCSKKKREPMHMIRHKIKINLQSVNDRINFSLKRRVFETERIKTELEWQKSNMIADKERFREEIDKLEDALDRKIVSKKLVETRWSERLRRKGPELCTDITATALNEERVKLIETTRILVAELEKTKGKYNILSDQIRNLAIEVEQKAHTIQVDQKCLKNREPLNLRKNE